VARILKYGGATRELVFNYMDRALRWDISGMKDDHSYTVSKPPGPDGFQTVDWPGSASAAGCAGQQLRVFIDETGNLLVDVVAKQIGVHGAPSSVDHSEKPIGCRTRSNRLEGQCRRSLVGCGW
jgi:hypothetical protein